MWSLAASDLGSDTAPAELATPDRKAASDPGTVMHASGSELVQPDLAGAEGTREAAWH